MSHSNSHYRADMEIYGGPKPDNHPDLQASRAEMAKHDISGAFLPGDSIATTCRLCPRRRRQQQHVTNSNMRSTLSWLQLLGATSAPTCSSH